MLTSAGSPLVAVTGASGFVGSHLVDELLVRGVRIRCLVRGGRRAWTRLGVELVDGALEDPAACADLVAGADAVVHVGGLGLRRFMENRDINVLGTRNLLNACTTGARDAHFLLLSSIKAALAEVAFAGAGRDYYAYSKWEAEQLVAEAGARGMPVSMVRAPAIYGPRDVNFLPLFRLAARGLLPRISGDMPLVSHVHVQDLAHFLVDRILGPRDGRTNPIECASPEPLDLNGFVAGLYAWARRRPPFHVSRIILEKMRGAAAALPGGHGERVALRLADLLYPGRVFERPVLARAHIPLSSGLAATGQWYRCAGWL